MTGLRHRQGVFPCRQPRRGIRIVHHSPDGLSDIGRLRHAGVILHAVEDLLADCVGSQPILTQVEWGKLKVQLPSNYATLLRLIG